MLESFTRLALDGDLELGPYSRFQWHHPGPLSFYAMAPVYGLTNGKSVGLNLAALIVNLLAIVTTIVCALRFASPLLCVSIAVGISLLSLRVPDLLISPWNPHLPVLAAIAMLTVAAAAINGSAVALSAVAVFASFAGQTHVALLPLAFATGVIAVGGFVWTKRHARASIADVVRGVMAAGVVAVAVWAPTFYEQFSHAPGNLSLLWQYFVTDTHPRPASSVAVSAWADMLVGPLRHDFYLAHGWRFVESPVTWAESLSGVILIALAAATVHAHRQQRRFDAAISAVLLAASVLSLFAATRMDAEVFDHAVFWIAAVGTLSLPAVVSAAFHLVPGTTIRDSRRRRTVGAACVGALAIVLWSGARQLATAVAASHAPPVESRTATEVARAVRREIEARHLLRPLIRFDQDAWGLAAGVVLELQKQGVPVAVEDDWLAMYTPAFAATGNERSEIALLGRTAHDRATGDTLIASSNDLLFAHLTIKHAP